MNTFMSGQNGHHFADSILRFIFLNENCSALSEISPKCIPKGLINNDLALIQAIGWCQASDKSLSEPMMSQFTDAYMCHSASLS